MRQHTQEPKTITIPLNNAFYGTLISLLVAGSAFLWFVHCELTGWGTRMSTQENNTASITKDLNEVRKTVNDHGEIITKHADRLTKLETWQRIEFPQEVPYDATGATSYAKTSPFSLDNYL